MIGDFIEGDSVACAVNLNDMRGSRVSCKEDARAMRVVEEGLIWSCV